MIFVVFLFLFSSVSCSVFQVHVALTGKKNERVLRFHSKDTDNEWVGSYRVNVSHSGLVKVLEPVSYGYHIKEEKYTRFVHEVLMKDLPVGEVIRFQIYCLGIKMFGVGNCKCVPSRIFETFIPDTRKKTEFIIVGDTMGDNFTKIESHIRDNEFKRSTLIAHLGDFVFSDRGEETLWDLYFEKFQDFNTLVPPMYVPGNHENSYNFRSFIERMPNEAGNNCGSFSNLYYSYNAGNIHFVALSSEPGHGMFEQGSDLLIWLENDLKKVNRIKYPHIFVYYHRPTYTTSKKHPPELILRKHTEDMFIHYDVTMVFAGHVHGYERNCQIVKDECITPEKKNIYLYRITEKGPIYITAGTGGKRSHTKYFSKEWPEWHLIRKGEHGYLKGVSYEDKKRLEFDFFQYNGETDSFVVTDRFVVIFGKKDNLKIVFLLLIFIVIFITIIFFLYLAIDCLKVANLSKYFGRRKLKKIEIIEEFTTDDEEEEYEESEETEDSSEL